jgi:cell division septation protein DedD
MLSILSEESAQRIPDSPQITESRIDPEPDFETQPEPAEFEIVMGRRQLASVLFVATVVVATFSAVSYLAGKSYASAPKIVERVVEKPVPQPAPASTPAAPPISSKSEEPIFQNPVTGSLYLQIGSVEKGIAQLLAEGLRAHGFASFAAPGASEKTFRVLIGPLKDSAEYQHTKQEVDTLELSTFARRYQQ